MKLGRWSIDIGLDDFDKMWIPRCTSGYDSERYFYIIYFAWLGFDLMIMREEN